VYPIGAFFNLAGVLVDKLFQRMTVEEWTAVLSPKVRITDNFDRVARTLKLELQEFVVFSSVVAAMGNPGQSNYAYANSHMDQIVRGRQADGFSGLSLQWGVIGNVGLASASKLEVMKGGDLLQRVARQKLETSFTQMERLLARGARGVYTIYVPASTDEVESILAQPCSWEEKLKKMLSRDDCDSRLALRADSIQILQIQNLLKQALVLLQFAARPSPLTSPTHQHLSNFPTNFPTTPVTFPTN
jgi:hypothetical protein